MPPIIRVRELSKRYRIGVRPGALQLRDRLSELARMPARALANWRHGRAAATDSDGAHIWALRDVSFDVQAGEILGVIGRNGAGKSTLLRILSRITEPSAGEVELYGRVASLLEVGTGFHQELTGRDNIYLSGTILGMRRAEVAAKFEEIVAFAEIDKFIDTPVKHYSSGMYFRLAFAIAAHLEPEILLIDEVLAVGDVMFQRKCLGKMENVARSGRTVLFVSHDMGAVEALCSSCLMLHQGRVAARGEPRAITREYLQAAVKAHSGHREFDPASAREGSLALIRSVRLRDERGELCAAVQAGRGLTIEVAFAGAAAPTRLGLALTVKTATGAPIFGVRGAAAEAPHPQNMGVIRCRFENLPLRPGSYLVDLMVSDAYSDLDIIREAISFDVLSGAAFREGPSMPAAMGPVFWPASFQWLEDEATPLRAAAAGRAS